MNVLDFIVQQVVHNHRPLDYNITIVPVYYLLVSRKKVEEYAMMDSTKLMLKLLVENFMVMLGCYPLNKDIIVIMTISG